MQIELSTEQSLADLQQIFHEQFPNLRLEFYRQAHEVKEGSPASERVEPQTKLGLFSAEAFKLSLAAQQKTKTFEQGLEDILGLGIQVFRRSGITWLQTTRTDEWTLGQQNQFAETQESQLEKAKTQNPEDLGYHAEFE